MQQFLGKNLIMYSERFTATSTFHFVSRQTQINVPIGYHNFVFDGRHVGLLINSLQLYHVSFNINLLRAAPIMHSSSCNLFFETSIMSVRYGANIL